MCLDKKKKDNSSKNYKLLIIVIATFVIFFVLLYTFFITKEFGFPDTPGGFGDMYGGLNAFFSGLALIGVILAIVMQKDELELQRQELIESRKEYAKSAEALTKQMQLAEKKYLEEKESERRRSELVRPRFDWTMGSRAVGNGRLILVKGLSHNSLVSYDIAVNGEHTNVTENYRHENNQATIDVTTKGDFQISFTYECPFGKSYVDIITYEFKSNQIESITELI